MNSTLADRFRYLRKIRDQATQDRLAEIMETKRSRVADIERGKVRELKADEAVKIASHFNIDGWWLITGLGQAESSDTQPIEQRETDQYSGYFPQEENLSISPSAQSDNTEDLQRFTVSNNRFEPFIPLGATLLVDRSRDPRDGEYLLISTPKGQYIKQYYIDFGQIEGEVRINPGDDTGWSLDDIVKQDGEVLGVIAEFHKNLLVE